MCQEEGRQGRPRRGRPWRPVRGDIQFVNKYKRWHTSSSMRGLLGCRPSRGSTVGPFGTSLAALFRHMCLNSKPRTQPNEPFLSNQSDNQPCQPTLSTNLVNQPCQPTLSTNLSTNDPFLSNQSCQPTCQPMNHFSPTKMTQPLSTNLSTKLPFISNQNDTNLVNQPVNQ
jgi:hypothetical protein